jgi:hypothetical protein
VTSRTITNSRLGSVSFAASRARASHLSRGLCTMSSLLERWRIDKNPGTNEKLRGESVFQVASMAVATNRRGPDREMDLDLALDLQAALNSEDSCKGVPSKFPIATSPRWRRN